ncbi:hypothetical protein Taro_048836, partial [Colocasia esculenta]|nr:hypothetical protein [Colocasia esculenta]
RERTLGQTLWLGSVTAAPVGAEDRRSGVLLVCPFHSAFYFMESSSGLMDAQTILEKKDAPSREPTVYFSREDVCKSMMPLKLAIIVRCSYGRCSIPEIKSFLSQRLSLKSDFIVSILNHKHVLFRFEIEEDFLKIHCWKSGYGLAYSRAISSAHANPIGFGMCGDGYS